MDDIYILHHDRSFLVSVLDGIRSQAHALGLFISERKTHITPLRQGFVLQNPLFFHAVRQAPDAAMP